MKLAPPPTPNQATPNQDTPNQEKLLSAFAAPLFRRTPAGWVPDPLPDNTVRKQTP
jgi:hypothetical protein